MVTRAEPAGERSSRTFARRSSLPATAARSANKRNVARVLTHPLRDRRKHHARSFLPTAALRNPDETPQARPPSSHGAKERKRLQTKILLQASRSQSRCAATRLRYRRYCRVATDSNPRLCRVRIRVVEGVEGTAAVDGELEALPVTG